MSPTTHAASLSSCLSAMLLLTLILSSGCHSQTDCEHCSDCLCQPDYLACFNSLDQIDVEGITHIPSSGHCTNSTATVYYVRSGKDLTLDCPTSVNVVYHSNIRWEFYSFADLSQRVEIELGTRFVRHGITGLTIPEVLPKDAGLYICQLSEIGSSTYPIVAGCVIIHDTVQFSSISNVTAVAGGSIILPTKLMFSSSATCRVRPRFTQVLLSHNGEDIIDCRDSSERVPTQEKTYNFYNFSTLENIILPSSVGEGEYLFGLQQCCPYSVLTMYYTVIVSSSSAISTAAPTVGPTGANISHGSVIPTMAPTVGPTGVNIADSVCDDKSATITALIVASTLLFIITAIFGLAIVILYGKMRQEKAKKGWMEPLHDISESHKT